MSAWTLVEWKDWANQWTSPDVVMSESMARQFHSLLLHPIAFERWIKHEGLIFGKRIKLSEPRSTSPTGGLKDEKIQRFDLIPPRMLQQLATLYGVGAAKYDDRNWELGIEFGKLFAALNRHLWKWWGGEEFDEEMGVHHLINVIWNATALFELLHTHPELDDSPVKRKSNG